MKQLFALCFLIVFASCHAGRYIESSETSNNRNNIFSNTRKTEFGMDIKKVIGKSITVK